VFCIKKINIFAKKGGFIVNKIELDDKLNIFFLGNVLTWLLFFIFQPLFAQMIIDYTVNNLSNVEIIFLIILGLELVSLTISVIIGILITEGIRTTSVLSASIMAYLLTLFIWIVISYIGLFIFYPGIFEEVSGIEIIFVIPQVIVDFSIYVLNDVIWLFIFSQITYFILFIIFLEIFYVSKKRTYEKYYEY